MEVVGTVALGSNVWQRKMFGRKRLAKSIAKALFGKRGPLQLHIACGRPSASR